MKEKLREIQDIIRIFRTHIIEKQERKKKAII